MKVTLDKAQKEFVRKLVRIQLKNLKNILHERCEIDVTMECIESGINKADLLLLVENNIQTYNRIFVMPERFLELPEDQIGILKHILHTEEFSPALEAVKRSIWIKMRIFEQFNYNPN